MMKVLVTGVNGQLGFDVTKALQRRRIPCRGVSRQEFDITDFKAAEGFLKGYCPDAVVHCAAYTAVDRAEEETALCGAVNAGGTENIARICREIDAKLVYISTDYVFPGTGVQYYGTDDKAEPVNHYGATKLAGEEAVEKLLRKYFIVRISWVFGKNGNNFVKTMLRLGKDRGNVSVVDDQIGSPTYTVDVAELICDMLPTEKYGIYHATNDGICSWAEFAEEIFRQAGRSVVVKHIKSSEYPTRAKRPANSRLSKEKLVQAGFYKLPPWQDAVRRYIKELEENETSARG